jgi:F-box and WD-40 domain protein 1/11
MAAPAAHRVVLVNDWAPYQEAMYDDGMADSLRAEGGSNAGEGLFPGKQRRATMSFPWRRRPRSSIFDSDGNVMTQVRDAVLEKAMQEPVETIRARPTKQEMGLKGLFKRASGSIRGVVHRRTPTQTPGLLEKSELTREATIPRPTTSHSVFHRLRQAASFRNSILFNPSERVEQEPLSPTVPVPGNGEQPPIIPHHTGAAAKAAASAHNEYFGFATTPAGAALLKHNNWLSITEGQNDDESGIGIALTSSELAEPESDVDRRASVASDEAVDGISRIDFVSQLPSELAIHILSLLDASGLAIACRVSRDWRRIASNQHIWRESYMREKTGTFATSGTVMPGRGLGVPRVLPDNDWREIYKVKEALDKRWKAGKARPIYLNGHQDSIYCLQFDEYVDPDLLRAV